MIRFRGKGDCYCRTDATETWLYLVSHPPLLPGARICGPDQGIFQEVMNSGAWILKAWNIKLKNIAAIDFQSPYYHVFMKPDEDREEDPISAKPTWTGITTLIVKRLKTGTRRLIMYSFILTWATFAPCHGWHLYYRWLFATDQTGRQQMAYMNSKKSLS